MGSHKSRALRIQNKLIMQMNLHNRQLKLQRQLASVNAQLQSVTQAINLQNDRLKNQNRVNNTVIEKTNNIVKMSHQNEKSKQNNVATTQTRSPPVPNQISAEEITHRNDVVTLSYQSQLFVPIQVNQNGGHYMMNPGFGHKKHENTIKIHNIINNGIVISQLGTQHGSLLINQTPEQRNKNIVILQPGSQSISLPNTQTSVWKNKNQNKHTNSFKPECSKIPNQNTRGLEVNFQNEQTNMVGTSKSNKNKPKRGKRVGRGKNGHVNMKEILIKGQVKVLTNNLSASNMLNAVGTPKNIESNNNLVCTNIDIKDNTPSLSDMSKLTQDLVRIKNVEYKEAINKNHHKFNDKSKICHFKHAELIGSLPTTCMNLADTQNNQNCSQDDYNVIEMDIDESINSTENGRIITGNERASKSKFYETQDVENASEIELDEIQNIESDILEILDIIKSNPTDFQTLLDIITNCSNPTKADHMLLNDIALAIANILRNSSSHTLKPTMSKEKTVSKISKKERRKRHLKTEHSIQKLFEQLRETSQNDSRNTSQSSSQINIIDLDDSNVTMIPEELRNFNQPDVMNTSIIIPDDEQKACSTPKRLSLQKTSRNSKSTHDDVILAQSNNKVLDNTRLINNSCWQTIDLTADSGHNKTVRKEPTVIDISDTCDDVTVVSATSSMSGDSQVTILKQPISRKLKKFTNGIANLNANEKGKLLELITQTIFNGCDVKTNGKPSLPNLDKSLPRAPQTAEDTYIKEVILGTKASRSSVGSNVYHPDRQRSNKTGPRMIVIDGSNVAMEHGRGQYFSVRGLQICIDYFLRRGHVVKAFVPRFRCKNGKSSDPRLLDFLERKGLVIYTPSREVQGRMITPYDDRYIIQCAAEFDGVVVSGDNYRDLVHENPRWRSVIDNRILPFTWVDDMIMFPRDPLGRNGPTLEQFLTHPTPRREDNNFIRII